MVKDILDRKAPIVIYLLLVQLFLYYNFYKICIYNQLDISTIIAFTL